MKILPPPPPDRFMLKTIVTVLQWGKDYPNKACLGEPRIIHRWIEGCDVTFFPS